MERQKGSLTGRCQGCNHPERVRIERFLAAGASIKGALFAGRSKNSPTSMAKPFGRAALCDGASVPFDGARNRSLPRLPQGSH